LKPDSLRAVQSARGGSGFNITEAQPVKAEEETELLQLVKTHNVIVYTLETGRCQQPKSTAITPLGCEKNYKKCLTTYLPRRTVENVINAMISTLAMHIRRPAYGFVCIKIK
jgi:hypothetical protein